MIMKRLLPMVLGGTLLLPVQPARGDEYGPEDCAKLAKELDDTRKEYPGIDLRELDEFFEERCLQRYGCPDFEKIRKMEVAMQQYYAENPGPGLDERLMEHVKIACHR